MGDVRVEGLAGLRAVITDTSFESEATASYTDWLPNVSAKIRFTDALLLRAAYTQTRTRPNFDVLRPDFQENFDINGTQSELFIRGGNPGLSPFTSDNYDISFEYYFSRTGFAAIGAFRRDIQGFITTTQRRTPLAADDPRNPTIGGTNPRSILLIEFEPVNAGAGTFQGIEAQFSTFFDFEFLPEWARGFGFQANYTLVDDEQDYREGEGAPVFTGRTLNVSRHSINLVGLYERGPLNARLAYNRRSRYLTGFDDPARGNFRNEYTDPVARLDFSISYALFENLTIAADVSNILGEPFKNFREYNEAGDTFPRDVRFEERVYSLGIRFRL